MTGGNFPSMGDHGTSPAADLIAAFVEELRIKGRAPRTIEERQSVLARVDRELPFGLDQAEPDEIKRWLYRDEWKPNTRAGYYTALNDFYSFWQGKPGGLSFNPMAELPQPAWKRGRPRPVTNGELARILTEAGEPYRLWALIAAYEGTRCIEISNLDREHVNEEVMYLLGKGGKERVVPTHPLVWEEVCDLPPGPIARNHLGERASTRYVSREANRHFRHVLKMPGVSMHRCRHWFGTHAQRVGRDVRVTQELLGHSSPATTAVYTQAGMDDMREAVVGLPRVTLPRAAGGPAGGGGVAEAA